VRVEILRELEPDDAKLEIPWSSSGDPSLRYVDLKAFPERIGELDESRRYPVLASFLWEVNSPGSSLRTAKCNVWTTTELSEDERVDFGLPHKVGSYVDLLFDRPELSSQLEPHLELGQKIEDMLQRERLQAQAEICVRQCLFHPEERWGYYLTLFVHGYGATPEEAEGEWTRAIGALGDALIRIEPLVRDMFCCEPREGGW